MEEAGAPHGPLRPFLGHLDKPPHPTHSPSLTAAPVALCQLQAPSSIRPANASAQCQGQEAKLCQELLSARSSQTLESSRAKHSGSKETEGSLNQGV